MELPQILREVLARRGIVTDEEVERYLNPSLGALARPDELPGVRKAAETILDAVRARRKIVVFGDYDCDGVCATAILVRTLQALKADVFPFLPERNGEGYGMSEAAVARMLEEYPDVSLVVTVDNGVNSVERVAELKSRGIEVVVTDHHLPGETLPDCTVVNPKVSAPEGLSELCGAAVAYMLANALMHIACETGEYSGGKIAGALLVMAGLATITDIMPLVGQNRIIVAEALNRFHVWAPTGLRELYAHAARSGSERTTAKDFGFLLGPRINAAGRMASATKALELLLTEDRESARMAAIRVDSYNVDRKTTEQKMVDSAIAQLVKGASAQIIDLSDGHTGVSGIVAARMVEHEDSNSVPVCVIVNRRGSARAPSGYNVRDAFVAASEALEDYGGHAAAGGFTIKEGRMDDFRRLFCDACAEQHRQLAAQDIRPGLVKSDIVVGPEDLTLELAEAIPLLEPFGEGNPEPVFELKNVLLTELRQVGSEGRHLGLSVRTGSHRLRCVWWNAGPRVEEFRSAAGIPFNALFTLAVSDYQERHVELRIVDLQAFR